MTSEIKVDTISENTSANGVAIDGVVIKDNTIDVNGTAGALILDADADTKIQASTDDNIEFLTGGAKQFNITNSGSIQAFRDSATSFGPSYLGQHQRGTIASPSIVQSGDRLVEFKSTAYDGTAYIDGPRISFRVDGTPGDDDMPSRIEFQTVADGSNALAERMRITSAGIVGMGANAGSCGLGSGLHIMTADSGATATAHGDELVIEDGTSGANVGISILSATDGEGRINFGDSGDNDIGMIRYDHADNSMLLITSNAEGIRITSSGQIGLNEDSVDVDQGGITMQQGANDAKILTFKSSDVGHGMTDVAETDTYGIFQKLSSDGGMHIKALHDSGDQAIRMEAMAVTENSTKGTTGNSPFQIRSAKKNNLGLQAFGSNANLFHVSNNGSTKFIVDAEGELHSDGGAQSAYDTYEDAQLVRAYDLSHGKGVIDSKFDDYIKYNHESLAEAGLVGREKDGTPNNFINVTGMQRLHNGAIWQQYEKHQKLASAFYKLAEKTIGKEEADKLLTDEEIKLLN
jgi:hypothetical protein